MAIIDCAPRKVPSLRLSNKKHAGVCVGALNDALATHGAPEIIDTAQGSRFTGASRIATMPDAGVRIAMDGRGRYPENIFTERHGRSVRQEAAHLCPSSHKVSA
ncbi:hypothetical protein [Sulfitobacter sabulilitoris]|uniref:Uncharacterized protein n=1 Tax=Sulfitobacter sabulilitoris TaxID=2562655 RepID=A0A5S3PLC6_9RHOB|nr:hypothetical protein [Sulfitobacter sabulilitoris]TMM55131.1 hypothetical protein FDT80_06065 [Sulfitobacter sabulilitoris]